MKVWLKAKFIRKKMIRRHLSQNDMAKMVGVSSGYMSQLMDGSRHPSPAVTQRIEAVFPELGFDDLFTIKEDPR